MAEMVKFVGGLPGARGGPIQILNMGINILHHTLCCNDLNLYPKNIGYKLTCFQCGHCPVLAGDIPTPALFLGNTRQV